MCFSGTEREAGGGVRRGKARDIGPFVCKICQDKLKTNLFWFTLAQG